MKTTPIFVLMLLAVSCTKADLSSEQQIVSFPSSEEEGVIEKETIFNQEQLNAYIDMTLCEAKDNETLAAFAKLEAISNCNSSCKVVVYYGAVPSGAKTLVPNGNISVFIDPDVAALKQISDNYGRDLSPFEGHKLIAVSDKGDMCVVRGFLEGDVLGTLNGFSEWVNGYSEQNSLLDCEENPNSSFPDAEKLFRSFQDHLTVPFELKDKVVASVVCSKEDKQSGKGTYDISYTVLPLHAFDDQPGKGDYYYVKGTFTLNSAGMYKGVYVSKHGGVKARICAFFADRYEFRSFLTDRNDNIAGHFVDRGTPVPGTTIGSTNFSTNMTWNINGGLTGGILGDDMTGNMSLSAGICVTNNESKKISDFECRLDASNATAKYVNDYRNLPYYQYLAIHVPSTTCISSVAFSFAYIIRVENVRDNSNEIFNINFCLDKLVYDHCRFYSSSVDMKWFEWEIKDMTDPTRVQERISWPIKVNRTPTGKLKIFHDTDTFGRYVYSVSVTQKGRKDSVEFTRKTFDVGDTFREYIPTGKWFVRMKVGESADKTQEIESVDSVLITRADSTQIITGAFFKKK